MKKKLLLFCTVLLLLQSCKTTLYKYHVDGDNFSKVQPENVYYIYPFEAKTQKVKISEISKDSIKATTNQQNFAFAKKDIKTIKKANPTATTAIVVGGVVGVLTFGYLVAKALQGVAENVNY